MADTTSNGRFLYSLGDPADSTPQRIEVERVTAEVSACLKEIYADTAKLAALELVDSKRSAQKLEQTIKSILYLPEDQSNLLLLQAVSIINQGLETNPEDYYEIILDLPISSAEILWPKMVHALGAAFNPWLAKPTTEIRNLFAFAALPGEQREQFEEQIKELAKSILTDPEIDSIRTIPVTSRIISEEDTGIWELLEAKILTTMKGSYSTEVTEPLLKALDSLPEPLRIKLLEQALKDPKTTDSYALMILENIQSLDTAARPELNEQAISRLLKVIDSQPEDKNVIVRAFRLLSMLPIEQAREFSSQMTVEPDQELAFQSPLHSLSDDQPVKFQKIGSGLRIMPTERIQRVFTIPNAEEPHSKDVDLVPVSSIEAWAVAYGAWPVWQEAGLDHIPVEPMMTIGKEGSEITIETVNLRGNSAAKTLTSYSIEAQKDIWRQMNLIKSTLKELGIEHGHTHLGNFVIVPSKDESGQPDPTQFPKVYIIDFDRASYTRDKNLHIDQLKAVRANFANTNSVQIDRQPPASILTL